MKSRVDKNLWGNISLAYGNMTHYSMELFLWAMEIVLCGMELLLCELWKYFSLIIRLRIRIEIR